MEMFLLSIAGTCLLLLIGVIAYFLKRFVKAVDDLTYTVDCLGDTVREIKLQNDSNKELCKFRHEAIERRFDKIEKGHEAHS